MQEPQNLPTNPESAPTPAAVAKGSLENDYVIPFTSMLVAEHATYKIIQRTFDTIFSNAVDEKIAGYSLQDCMKMISGMVLMDTMRRDEGEGSLAIVRESIQKPTGDKKSRTAETHDWRPLKEMVNSPIDASRASQYSIHALVAKSTSESRLSKPSSTSRVSVHR